jgi:hypothetical protein
MGERKYIIIFDRLSETHWNKRISVTSIRKLRLSKAAIFSLALRTLVRDRLNSWAAKVSQIPVSSS